MNGKTYLSLGLVVAGIGAAFGTEWTSGDLTVAQGETVKLTEAGKTNSSLTLHGNFTVAPAGAKDKTPSYKVGRDTNTVSAIALGPDVGDDAVFSLQLVTLNSKYVGGNDTWRANLTVGESGGNGIFQIGTAASWKQSDASLSTFTLSRNAQLRAGETDFPAIEIGYAGVFVVSTVRNENAKPLRIRFMNKSNATDTFPAALQSYWKHKNGFLHVEDANSSIILEGGKTGTHTSAIRLKHWGWDNGDTAVNTILTSDSKGRVKTTGACDLYLDTVSSNVFKIASKNFDWCHSGNTYLQATVSDDPSQLNSKSGQLIMGVTDGLPYGTQTGDFIVRTLDTAVSSMTLDLAGYSQKLNGLSLIGPSVLKNSDANAATVTFGAGGASGCATGTFTQDNIRFEKVDSGVLTLSNATFTTLCVTGGRIRIAPNSANVIGTLAITNATLELPADAPNATLTVGTRLFGEGASRMMSLPEGQPSNVVALATATMDPLLPLVKEGGGYVTCTTPASANGTDLDVRGGVLRMGGCACANKYWKMVFKKSSATGGVKTWTDAEIPAFKFEMTLGLGNIGLFAANGNQAVGDTQTAYVGNDATKLSEGQASSKNPCVATWSCSDFRSLYGQPSTKIDPVLTGGSAGGAHRFVSHEDSKLSANLYDDDHTDQQWAGPFAWCVLYTNGTSRALNPNDSTTWEEIVWRAKASWPSVTSYNLRRFVNNNRKDSPHPTDWELWSSPDGSNWTKMDERSGQTFGTESEGAKLNAQFAYTYNHHVPYLFEALNANWSFNTFGKVSVAAGATLDLDSIPDANVAFNALAVDLTAGAGTITKFVPATGGTLYLTHPREADLGADGQLRHRIALPLSVGRILEAERLKTWAVRVDGVAIGDAELVAIDGNLVVKVRHGFGLYLK